MCLVQGFGGRVVYHLRRKRERWTHRGIHLKLLPVPSQVVWTPLKALSYSGYFLCIQRLHCHPPWAACLPSVWVSALSALSSWQEQDREVSPVQPLSCSLFMG